VAGKGYHSGPVRKRLSCGVRTYIPRGSRRGSGIGRVKEGQQPAVSRTASGELIERSFALLSTLAACDGRICGNTRTF
jgi:hypothetical protein